jgi:hypothetical protein
MDILTGVNRFVDLFGYAQQLPDWIGGHGTEP